MNIDKFLKMGHSHTLLEDAVLTGYGSTPYLIVCDGCSDSENTHIGSHLLARSAQIEIESGINLFKSFDDENNTIFKSFLDSIIFRARSMADVMGFDYSALDATLLLAFIIEDKIQVVMVGDGCLYYKKEGVTYTYSSEYFGNMPYYLSYSLNAKRHEAYKNAASKHIENSGKSLKKVFYWKNEEENHYESNVFKPLIFSIDLEDLEYLILSTDGIESFDVYEEREFNSIDKAMHSFKNFNGEFLQRRMKRILKEELKNGRNNFDDLGIAAITFKG